MVTSAKYADDNILSDFCLVDIVFAAITFSVQCVSVQTSWEVVWDGGRRGRF